MAVAVQVKHTHMHTNAHDHMAMGMCAHPHCYACRCTWVSHTKHTSTKGRSILPPALFSSSSFLFLSPDILPVNPGMHVQQSHTLARVCKGFQRQLYKCNQSNKMALLHENIMPVFSVLSNEPESDM